VDDLGQAESIPSGEVCADPGRGSPGLHAGMEAADNARAKRKSQRSEEGGKRMNRNKLFSFFFIFLCVTMLARATDVLDVDGTQWIANSGHINFGFVCGYLTGLSLMEKEVVSYLLRAKKHEDYNKASVTIKGFIDIPAGNTDDLSLFDITVGQLVDGLDVFYADFSTRKIKIVDAIYVVKMQINGKNADLITAQVRFLKMHPISTGESNALNENISKINDYKKALKDGVVTEDELLKNGIFVDKNGESHFLFCYGEY
jgi:hypothetical protein